MSKPYAYLALLLIAGCGNPAIDEPDSSQSADLAMPDISGPAGCSPACAGLTSKCNAAKHCVGCLADSDCAMGTYCKIVSDAVASCVPGCNVDANCGNGQKCCSGQCIDPMTDARNCGDCAAACMTPNSGAACVGGMCVAGQCKPGYGDCNKDPKDGCETNLHIDPNNCVMCGAACDIPNAYASCADGCYSTACKFGFDDCNMNPMDGCETAVRSDPKNCG
ncbi:MAG TPA: Dickkopf N-terminal cysteine-rich domain-containing protein, partial [Actinomycetota bacterium]|nr:Dickkopf N-terminal cysteine-rich domain-containing protein [Actinomycetota bacterium]